jgi:signal transduction histidine kinase
VLIDNAVKYSKSPGVVRVSLTRRQSKAELRVRNDGETISPDELTHIFERFYRSDRARAGDGYGLGLAIAKNIAELHGGKITAESDGEHGTTFTVTLPAV